MNDFNAIERHDNIQRLQRANGLDDYYSRHDSEGGGNAITSVTLILIGAVIGMVALATLRSCDKAQEPRPAVTWVGCQDCHRPSAHAEMTEYFRKAGSSQPERMATAVLMTKRPRLLAAVAKVESGGNPQVKRTGYKRRHYGSFQVSPRHWGRVPNDAIQQAQQADAVLDELVADHKGDIRKALNSYGGDKTKRVYALNILRELENVPQ